MSWGDESAQDLNLEAQVSISEPSAKQDPGCEDTFDQVANGMAESAFVVGEATAAKLPETGMPSGPPRTNHSIWVPVASSRPSAEAECSPAAAIPAAAPGRWPSPWPRDGVVWDPGAAAGPDLSEGEDGPAVIMPSSYSALVAAGPEPMVMFGSLHEAAASSQAPRVWGDEDPDEHEGLDKEAEEPWAETWDPPEDVQARAPHGGERSAHGDHRDTRQRRSEPRIPRGGPRNPRGGYGDGGGAYGEGGGEGKGESKWNEKMVEGKWGESKGEGQSRPPRKGAGRGGGRKGAGKSWRPDRQKGKGEK